MDSQRGAIEVELGEHLRSGGLFRENPIRSWRESRLQRVGWMFVGVFASALVGSGVGLWIFQSELPGSTLSGGIMLLLGAAAVVLSTMRAGNLAPTPAGLREIGKWSSFKLYLERGRGGTSMEDQFDRYLSYALALGASDGWIERAATARVTTPSWFYSPGTNVIPATLAVTKDNFKLFISEIERAFGYGR